MTVSAHECNKWPAERHFQEDSIREHSQSYQLWLMHCFQAHDVVSACTILQVLICGLRIFGHCKNFLALWSVCVVIISLAAVAAPCWYVSCSAPLFRLQSIGLCLLSLSRVLFDLEALATYYLLVFGARRVKAYSKHSHPILILIVNKSGICEALQCVRCEAWYHGWTHEIS